MEISMKMTLNAIEDGTQAIIAKMPAGECGQRLEALGLYPGKAITKISGMPFQGPVTILLDQRQIAIGHGVSSRLLVDVESRDRTSS
jgi:ferrous iron transport protein A